MGQWMELRHLRYFVAIAEEGSLTVAAEKRLHTAQPSLSRQMRDLEQELGVALMVRGARGIELTAAGRVFLDHARVALLQVEAAAEAARRAGQPARSVFTLGFLTGYEMEWLPAVMALLREALPNTEVVIHSQSSPELAVSLMRGRIDLGLLRPEKNVTGVTYKLLREEPLLVLLGPDHPLASQDAIRVKDILGGTLIGVPHATSPVLRAVTDAYARQHGLDLTPHHEVDNLSMAFSMIASTNGIGLFPLYARNLLPASVVSRPIRGVPPMIDLCVGYNTANTSPLLKFLLSKIEDLKFRVSSAHPEVGSR
jgi:LysR family transcriptional regulator, hca operon transcriptional activator